MRIGSKPAAIACALFLAAGALAAGVAVAFAELVAPKAAEPLATGAADFADGALIPFWLRKAEDPGFVHVMRVGCQSI